MIKKVNLFNEFKSNTLSYRENCKRLFRIINKEKNLFIIINFFKINSISRSFIDEFLNQKQLSHKVIFCINQNNHIKKVFQAVKTNSKINSHQINPDNFKTVSF